jgi:hypothetical protein
MEVYPVGATPLEVPTGVTALVEGKRQTSWQEDPQFDPVVAAEVGARCVRAVGEGLGLMSDWDLVYGSWKQHRGRVYIYPWKHQPARVEALWVELGPRAFWSLFYPPDKLDELLQYVARILLRRRLEKEFHEVLVGMFHQLAAQKSHAEVDPGTRDGDAG